MTGHQLRKLSLSEHHDIIRGMLYKYTYSTLILFLLFNVFVRFVSFIYY